jgi:hypothetical protein
MNRLLNSTEKAFIKRGIPSDVAKNLKESGYTLNGLKYKSLNDLVSLKIPIDVAKKILSTRPTIPEKTLTALLNANKWACCVCHNVNLPIIVHHIKPWFSSRSHNISNLAVLCPTHHAFAHSTSELTISLTAEKLLSAKRHWEAQVKNDDSVAVRKAVQSVGDHWYFFNLPRIIEIAESQNIDLKKLDNYACVRKNGLITSSGNLIPEENGKYYSYAGRNNILRYDYARELFLHVLNKLSIENISDRLDRSDIGSSLISDDIIYIQGAHSFQMLNNNKIGSNQDVKATRSANNVVITYTFDRWHATSSSARSEWLSGRSAVGSICRVGKSYREDGKVIVKCTVLAICNEVSDLKKRDYLNR